MENDRFEVTGNGYLKKTPMLQFIMVSVLFALWGMASSLNDILITQFKTIFSLSDFASAFVQSAFYGGYFLIAIPASLLIKKTSYRAAIVSGLTFYIVGCLLFFPASHKATYGMFLFAIFVLAVGLSFLETSSNTYSSLLGPEGKATWRLNVSETLNAVGCIIGITLGKFLVFKQGAERLETQLKGLGNDAARQLGLENLQRTLLPYKYILVVLIIMLALFIIVKFPNNKVVEHEKSKDNDNIGETLKRLFSNSRYKKGVLAQFFYMGVQIGVWSFTIRLALNINHNLSESIASNYMIYSYIALFIGRFLGSYLLSKFSTTKTLLWYAAIGTVLIAYMTVVPNMTAIYAAILVSILMGPCWASIYAHTLSVIEDKRDTETGGAIIVMAIVGGAVLPAMQGFVSDRLGSLQLSFIVPTLSFLYVAYYFYKENKLEKMQ